MTKLFRKILILSSFCVCLLIMTGCFVTNIVSVSLKTDVTGEIGVNNFDLSQLEILVTYDDKSVNYVQVTEAMLSSYDIEKLKTVGVHEITINYKGNQLKTTITLVEESKDPVMSIYIQVNKKKYEILEKQDFYTVTCTHDAQYIWNYIKINLNIGYSFASEGVNLYINDELIDSSKYTIENNELVYKYKDPNWSPIL